MQVELRLETGDAVEVRAPRSALMRVLINLLRNAAHAIDELEDMRALCVLEVVRLRAHVTLRELLGGAERLDRRRLVRAIIAGLLGDAIVCHHTPP